MTNLISYDDLPIYAPCRIISTNEDSDWVGIKHRTYHYESTDAIIPGINEFMIVAYNRGSVKLSRKVEGRWSIDQMGTGDISLLSRSDASHWTWKGDLEVEHIYLTDSFMGNIAKDVLRKELVDVHLNDVLKMRDPQNFALIQAIAAEGRSPALGGSLYAEALCTQLTINLLRSNASLTIRETQERGRLSDRQARLLNDFIDSLMDHQIKLVDLAELVCLGVPTFSRLFRKTFGVAPHAYVMRRRIQKAHNLLKFSPLAIKQIAAVCGFVDQAHLTRVFKKAFNRTPADFRLRG